MQNILVTGGAGFIGSNLVAALFFSFSNLKSKTFKGLPGLIADALPDDYGNSVIDEWFSIRGKTVEITPIDRLCYIGKRGMGALEFEPANDDVLLNESSDIDIQELVALAQQILDKRSAFSTILDNKNEPSYNLSKKPKDTASELGSYDGFKRIPMNKKIIALISGKANALRIGLKNKPL